jgi:chromosome partitioning protein
MPVYVFAGQKGGTGKTTLAVATAAELVARSRKVLLVDADPQRSASTWAALATEAGNAAPATIAMGANMHRPGQLDEVAAPFEVVVIDTPPQHSDILRAALMVADTTVLPCGPSPLDAWALAETLELVGQARGLRPGLKVCAVVNRMVARTAVAARTRAVLVDNDLIVLGTALHSRVAYLEAMAAGLGAAQYAPDTPAAAEVRAFVDELEHFNSTGEVKDGQTSLDNAQAA